MPAECEPELSEPLHDEELLRIADVVEENVTKYIDRKRLHLSIFRQTVIYRKPLRLVNETPHYSKITREPGPRNSTPLFLASRENYAVHDIQDSKTKILI